MHSGERWQLGHRPALDGLRGVAVLLVVAGHTAPGLFSLGGAVGVSVFFALSGFLITTLLLEGRDRTGRLGLRGFYFRRARRLLPALVVFLAGMVVLGALLGPWLATPSMVVPPLLYVQNFAVQNGHPVGGLLHLWSLSVEEQFYLLWPAALALVGLIARRWALGLVALALVASAGVRVWLYADGASAYRIYFASDTNACLILAGCAAALVVRHWVPTVPQWAFTAAVVSMVALGALPNTAATLTLVPLAAVALAVVAILRIAGDRAPHTADWLNLIGRRSYALYLWHMPLVAYIPHHLAASHWITVPIGLAASWGLTLLSWRYVEEPFLRRQAHPPAPAPVVALAMEPVQSV